MSDAGSTAIVTGSSTGIGKAIAIGLLNAGYAVVLNYAQDIDEADRTLAQCREINSRVVLEKADVSIGYEAGRLIGRAVSEFGRLDVLVNNAARVADGPLLAMTEDEWDRVVNVNMKGAFLC